MPAFKAETSQQMVKSLARLAAVIISLITDSPCWSRLHLLMSEEQNRTYADKTASCRSVLLTHSNRPALKPLEVNHPRDFLIKKSFTSMAMLSPTCHSQPSLEF